MKVTTRNRMKVTTRNRMKVTMRNQMKASMRNKMKVSTTKQKLTQTTLLTSAVGASTSISAKLSLRLVTNPEDQKPKS